MLRRIHVPENLLSPATGAVGANFSAQAIYGLMGRPRSAAYDASLEHDIIPAGEINGVERLDRADCREGRLARSRRQVAERILPRITATKAGDAKSK